MLDSFYRTDQQASSANQGQIVRTHRGGTQMQRQSSIELHIERMVLDGFSMTCSQGALVQAAVESGLARLIGEQGLPGTSAKGIPHLRCSSIQMTEDREPAHLGDQIALVIHRSLVPATSNALSTSRI
jgi:hypothetical protein